MTGHEYEHPSSRWKDRGWEMAPRKACLHYFGDLSAFTIKSNKAARLKLVKMTENLSFSPLRMPDPIQSSALMFGWQQIERKGLPPCFLTWFGSFWLLSLWKTENICEWMRLWRWIWISSNLNIQFDVNRKCASLLFQCRATRVLSEPFALLSMRSQCMCRPSRFNHSLRRFEHSLGYTIFQDWVGVLFGDWTFTQSRI
jgi:hypothetical protein